MANTRLTCVVRKGLGLPEGLLAAQVAHISDQWMRTRIIDGKAFSNEEFAWCESPYISVLSVDTLEELKHVYAEAQRAGLDPVAWRDLLPSKVLKTSLPDVFVGFTVGPTDFDKIQAVTSKLPLY